MEEGVCGVISVRNVVSSVSASSVGRERFRMDNVLDE